MASAALKYVTVSPAAAHKATIVFVHGLGDSGFGWEPVAKMFSSDPSLKHIKWILPHAPVQPVTCNFGMEMPSWFDIPNLPVEQRTVEDEPGMLKSSQLLKDLIESEISSTGINPDRIILGGFSQGGALSILTGLTYERHLAGVVALSCYAPLREKLKKIVNPALSKIPLFVGHGTHDPLISVTFADKTLEYLTTELGYSRATSDSPAGVEFHKYGGLEHSTSMEELQDLKAWIKRVIPA